MSYIKSVLLATFISGMTLTSCSNPKMNSSAKQDSIINLNHSAKQPVDDCYVTRPAEDSLKQIENEASIHSYSQIKSGIKKALNALKDTGNVAARVR